jgi:hypothetical protein
MRHPAAMVMMAILALVLPVQGMALVAMGMRGPAHFHTASTADEGGHTHTHTSTEHHHHHADEEGVMLVEADDDDHHQLESMEEGASRQANGGSGDALPSMAQPVRMSAAAHDLTAADAVKPPRAFIGRLERPPDTSPAGI